MLPDISKRKHMYAMQRRMYDHDMLKKALNRTSNDGVTTRNAKDIVMGLNGYAADASTTIFYLYAALSFYESIADGAYDECEDGYLHLYGNPAVKSFAKRSARDLWNMVRSIRKHKDLAYAVKSMVKVNKINKDWENLLNGFITDLNNRLEYLMKVVLPEHIKFTPLYLMLQSFDESGKDVRAYIRSIKTDDAADEKLVVERVRTAVNDAIAGVDKAQLDIWEGELTAAVDTLIKKDIQRTEMVKRDAEDELKRRKERVRDDVLSVCSLADKLFSKYKTTGSARYYCQSPVVYCIMGARISRSRERTSVMYGLNPTTQTFTKSFANTRIYRNKDDAESALGEYRKNDDIIAEIAYIDNPMYNPA